MKRNVWVVLSAFALVALAGAADGQTVTVTISDDDIDVDWESATIADLPGPDGEVSFSEALIATNNTPGHQTIGFAIPQSDWQLQFVYPGQAVLRSVTGYFWRATDEVTIDGTTQTAFTGDTNPDGWEVVLDGLTLYLNADNCTVIGFNHSDVMFTRSYGRAEGNTGSMYISAIGGGNHLIKDNQGWTIKIDQSNDNVVVGNTVSRIRVLGDAQWGGNPATGNRIGGPNLEDRNFLTGYGGYHEGRPNGTTLQIFDTVGTIVENNYIGTTPDGMDFGTESSTVGVGFEGVNHDVIIRNNLIAVLGIGTWPHHFGELFGWGIVFQGTASNIDVVGNTIGLNAVGEPVLGSVYGMDIGSYNYFGMSGIRIGGPNPGDGNIIAGHVEDGVKVGFDAEQARISGNSIYGNGQLGIELLGDFEDDGVNPNDPLDADTGASGLQNFPVIGSAAREGASLRVIGTLPSSPSGSFTVDFYASSGCDATGFGEGEVFLGSTSVTTDAAGNSSFDEVLVVSPPEGWVVTSTATLEPIGATSEFSECAEIVGSVTGVESLPETAVVLDLRSYPNPFRRATTVAFELRRPVSVSLAVYDVAGRRVRVLMDGEESAGAHRVLWDGRDDDGREVGGGVYFYRIQAGDRSLTKRTIVTQ